jgi:hypothetical protein
MKIIVRHLGPGDESISDLLLDAANIHEWVHKTHKAGGFFTGNHKEKNFVFVPWHRIRQIEQVEEEDAAEKGQEQKGG